MNQNDFIIEPDEKILITGAAGFIGARVVASLLDHGYSNLRCFVRPSGNRTRLNDAIKQHSTECARVELFEGNLLSQNDCDLACKEVAVVYHLAAARGEKSFPDAFMNSVVTSRNLLQSLKENGFLRRIVNISSFSVYSNLQANGGILDETCPIEPHPELRGDAYCFAKVKQEELVAEYGKKYNIPYVMIRPGFVYGPGNEGITGRVGLSGFGIFLHLGGSNQIPFAYVDNCAEAIVLAGLRKGIDGEAFNVLDDNMPNSRRFLSMYKKNVQPFKSIYLPHCVSYLLCFLWEKFSEWSCGQLPPAYNRKSWRAYWKKTRYVNDKAKRGLGWQQKTPPDIALNYYFQSCRLKRGHA